MIMKLLDGQKKRNRERGGVGDHGDCDWAEELPWIVRTRTEKKRRRGLASLGEKGGREEIDFVERNCEP